VRAASAYKRQRSIRVELLDSDRWLGLPSPKHRLAFVALLLVADDYGNVEGGTGFLVRLWRDPCGISGNDAAVEIATSLQKADLIQPYDADGKRWYHIPRYQQRIRSIIRRVPPSPWDVEPETPYESTSGPSDSPRSAAVRRVSPHSAAFRRLK